MEAECETKSQAKHPSCERTTGGGKLGPRQGETTKGFHLGGGGGAGKSSVSSRGGGRPLRENVLTPDVGATTGGAWGGDRLGGDLKREPNKKGTWDFPGKMKGRGGKK